MADDGSFGSIFGSLGSALANHLGSLASGTTPNYNTSIPSTPTSGSGASGVTPNTSSLIDFSTYMMRAQTQSNMRKIDPYLTQKLSPINVDPNNLTASVRTLDKNVILVDNKIKLLGQTVTRNLAMSSALIEYNKKLSDILRRNQMDNTYNRYKADENKFESAYLNDQIERRVEDILKKRRYNSNNTSGVNSGNVLGPVVGAAITIGGATALSNDFKGGTAKGSATLKGTVPETAGPEGPLSGLLSNPLGVTALIGAYLWSQRGGTGTFTPEQMDRFKREAQGSSPSINLFSDSIGPVTGKTDITSISSGIGNAPNAVANNRLRQHRKIRNKGTNPVTLFGQDYINQNDNSDVAAQHNANLQEVQDSSAYVNQDVFNESFTDFTLNTTTFKLNTLSFSIKTTRDFSIESENEIIIKSNRSITLDAPFINLIGKFSSVDQPSALGGAAPLDPQQGGWDRYRPSASMPTLSPQQGGWDKYKPSGPSSPYTTRILDPKQGGWDAHSNAVSSGSSMDEHAAVLTILGEAGGQGVGGMASVAEVIKNRSIRAGKSPYAIVSQSGQFDGYWAGKTKNYTPQQMAEALKIYRGVMNGSITSPTPGAVNFHANYVRPGWANVYSYIGESGGQKFYGGTFPGDKHYSLGHGGIPSTSPIADNSSSGDTSLDNNSSPKPIANFMRPGKQYGVPGADIANHLTKITAGGQTIVVNKDSADAFKGFYDELSKDGMPLGSIGGYNPRPGGIAGTGIMSQHAMGNASDFGSQSARNVIDPQTRAWIEAHPDKWRAALNRWGIISGGDFHSGGPDLGHVEWGGTKPWEIKPATIASSITPNKKGGMVPNANLGASLGSFSALVSDPNTAKGLADHLLALKTHMGATGKYERINNTVPQAAADAILNTKNLIENGNAPPVPISGEKPKVSTDTNGVQNIAPLDAENTGQIVGDLATDPKGSLKGIDLSDYASKYVSTPDKVKGVKPNDVSSKVGNALTTPTAIAATPAPVASHPHIPRGKKSPKNQPPNTHDGIKMSATWLIHHSGIAIV